MKRTSRYACRLFVAGCPSAAPDQHARKVSPTPVSTTFSVRVSYPETGDYNWHDALAPYAEIGAVEVAFYQPEHFLEKVKVAEVIAPFATPSLHNRGPLPSTESGKGEG